MLKEAAVFIICFLGLFLGLLLKRIIKDEAVNYKKGFFYFRNILLIAIGILLMYYSSVNWISLGLFFLGLIVGWFFKVKQLFLGTALIISSLISLEVFLAVSGLIFVYHLYYGIYLDKKKFYYALLFFIPLLFNFPSLNYLTYFIAGCLFFEK